MRKKERRIVRMTIDPGKRPPPLTAREKREVAALGKMKDEEIDYSDIPSLTPELLRSAVRGGLYRPMKRQMTVRLDADVLAWLRSQGKGYHSRLNLILRNAMTQDIDNAQKARPRHS